MTVTLQGLRMKTEAMMEEIRRRAIDDTIEKFKEAARTYYQRGYDNGETVKLVHDLMDLGVPQEAIIDIEFSIRDEVEEEKAND